MDDIDGGVGTVVDVNSRLADDEGVGVYLTDLVDYLQSIGYGFHQLKS